MLTHGETMDHVNEFKLLPMITSTPIKMVESNVSGKVLSPEGNPRVNLTGDAFWMRGNLPPRIQKPQLD